MMTSSVIFKNIYMTNKKSNRRTPQKPVMNFFKPISLLEVGEIGYIVPDKLEMVCTEETKPVYRFYISKAATVSNIPFDRFTCKMVRTETGYEIDDTPYYQSGMIWSGVPESMINLQYYYPAQTINYKFFVGKIYRTRMSLQSCLRAAVVICEKAFNTGTMPTDDYSTLDQYIGYISLNKDKWLQKSSIKILLKEYDFVTKEALSLIKAYNDQDIDDEMQYLEWDIVLLSILKELEEGVIERVTAILTQTPNVILELSKAIQDLIVYRLKNKEDYKMLASLQQVGIKIPE